MKYFFNEKNISCFVCEDPGLCICAKHRSYINCAYVRLFLRNMTERKATQRLGVLHHAYTTRIENSQWYISRVYMFVPIFFFRSHFEGELFFSILRVHYLEYLQKLGCVFFLPKSGVIFFSCPNPKPGVNFVSSKTSYPLPPSS